MKRTAPHAILYFMRPPFKHFPDLSNSRVMLREIRGQDIADLIAISFYDGKPAQDENDARVMLHKINADYLAGSTIHWGITIQGQNRILGTCGFYRGFKNDTGEIGYVLNEHARGKGVMTDAIRLVVKFGWEALSLQKIIAITDRMNVPSQKVLERVGFQLKTEDNSGELTYELSALND